MKLYIIRHGETAWNKERKLQGQSDVELNEYGRELAQITADALADIHWDVIYASPLKRAYETAQIIRGNRSMEIITDDRLKEIAFGEDEGVAVENRREDFANFFFAPDKFVPSKGGESIEMVCMRAKSFLDEVIKPYIATDQSVLIVAHGAMNKAIMLNLKHDEIKDFWSGEFQKNCCVNEYVLDENGLQIVYEAKIFYEGETTNYLEK